MSIISSKSVGSCLPEDLFFKTLIYLTPSELGTICQVNKTWKTVSENDILWRPLTEKRFPISLQIHLKNWKETFKTLEVFNMLLHRRFDILPFLKEGDSYGVQLETN
jgi:hypothetical protein